MIWKKWNTYQDIFGNVDDTHPTHDFISLEFYDEWKNGIEIQMICIKS